MMNNKTIKDVETGHDGYLNSTAAGMTFSGDSTGHRSHQYSSRFTHLQVEDYGGNGEKTQESRFLGLKAPLDGSSKESMKDWRNILDDIMKVYNDSPLAQRTGGFIQLADLLMKVMGMNSDHCSKEKKDAEALKNLKEWAVAQNLGEEAILEMPAGDINDFLNEQRLEMLEEAGGVKKWNSLSDIERSERNAAMFEKAVGILGQEAFEKLPETEKRILRLFIWAGCGCHKDLNTVRGGYAAMAKFWGENNLDGPVLLANKDNDPILQEREQIIEQGGTPTPAQEHAFYKSNRGAIKAAEIGGGLLNHKDNKKGHHDVFRFWWWEHVGIAFTFPDTSNSVTPEIVSWRHREAKSPLFKLETKR